MEILENISNPGLPPADGDYIRVRIGKHILERQHNEPKDPTNEELELLGRLWRTEQLQKTDWIVPITDHPQHAAYMTYRQALRDWPSTADFPDTRPELGA